MTDKLVSALGVEIFQEGADPQKARPHFKHVAVVADRDVLALCELFFGTATYLHVVIPSQAGRLATTEAYKKAVEFGAFNRGLIYGVVVTSDLSGIDTDALDGIVISTDKGQIMEAFIGHASRVVKECGRVVVVTSEQLDDKYFGDRAVAGLKKVEDFYCGTVRKTRAKVGVPRRKPSKSRRKPVKRQEPVDLADVPRVKIGHGK